MDRFARWFTHRMEITARQLWPALKYPLILYATIIVLIVISKVFNL